MAAPADTFAAEIEDLNKLATELTARGLRSHLEHPPGALPRLTVTNPRATALHERVFAQANSYWWSWCERLADCDEPATAAGILANVLREFPG